ncbi:MAG: hypothetical protein ACREHG_03475 [Candidatus Saccharimonadales bacterium]
MSKSGGIADLFQVPTPVTIVVDTKALQEVVLTARRTLHFVRAIVAPPLGDELYLHLQRLDDALFALSFPNTTKASDPAEVH